MWEYKTPSILKGFKLESSTGYKGKILISKWRISWKNTINLRGQLIRQEANEVWMVVGEKVECFPLIVEWKGSLQDYNKTIANKFNYKKE